MPQDAAGYHTAPTRYRTFASAKGMLVCIPADGTKILTDEKKILSDEKKIPDVVTTPRPEAMTGQNYN